MLLYNSFLQKSWEIFIKYAPVFWHGVKTTMILAVFGTVTGLLIGLVLGSLKATKVESKDHLIIKILKKIAHFFVAFYVWFLRGTPMMIQSLLFYFLLKPYLNWTPFIAGMTIISINTGAYMSEIIRSGIQSIDKGQNEAARSLGMTNLQTMIYVILPQAIKNSFPSIGNEFIVNIKDSCVLNVIGVLDLMFQTSSVAGSIFLFENTYLITTIIYLILTTIATLLLNIVEKKLQCN